MSQNFSSLRVFVSSTSEDLKDYRAVARHIILDIGWHPEMMEHFGASSLPTVEACLDKLKRCDLVLLILAFRKGWVPSKEQGGNGVDSITALELAYGREHNIPVLAMLADEKWPGNLWEDDDPKRAWIKKFRANLNLPAEFFNHEEVTDQESERLPSFRAKVRQMLVSYKERLLTKKRPSSEIGSGLDYFESACEGVVEGSSIPFLGHGVYGDGPLGTQALIRAMGEKKCSEESCLATAAEYLERYMQLRKKFLKKLRETIKEQTNQVKNLAVHDMILQVKTPALIVSSTYDEVLEDRLAAKGKTYVVVSHIIHSANGDNDGRILLVRPAENPEITVADKIEFRREDLIIYKPLGSPLLNSKPDPNLNIDTVVITETDHLTFLGRLENQHTRIPEVFSRIFQQNSLLFLGYALDVWHYRLVMGVFQSVGAGRSSNFAQAVRVPSSPMETLAWQRLGADLIPMDAKEFAQKVSAYLRKQNKGSQHDG